MSLDLEVFETAVTPDLKLVLAADVCKAYHDGRVPWRIAHSALRRLGVPTPAITEGLHVETVHSVPAVIRPYLEN